MALAPITFWTPLKGVVHPATWKRPPGNTDFRVTSPFGWRDLNGDGDHLDANEFHYGLDFGDGDPDADLVKTPLPGKVVFTRTDDGVVIVEHTPTWRSVLAHLRLPFEVAVGQVLDYGQKVGNVGSTGASSSHLHQEAKQLVDGAWLHRDPWPLLAFNQVFVANAGTTAGNIRSAPSTSAPIVGTIRADGLYNKAGDRVATSAYRMDIRQPSFTMANGLVWVKVRAPAALSPEPVYIWKNLGHFDL